MRHNFSEDCLVRHTILHFRQEGLLLDPQAGGIKVVIGGLKVPPVISTLVVIHDGVGLTVGQVTPDAIFSSETSINRLDWTP